MSIYVFMRSGPTTVEIENADKAQAKVANLKVGEYKFSLTVKDKDQLESTAKTTINVKESKYNMFKF